ncbi:MULTISPECIES: hypothetical protein [unclassified Roseobacter]|uniref:hypothetical protein n=1 Tax=unclassified Roseobacter TaxID=196798 RepID=UPI0018A2EAB6|nr:MULTISPECIES: hypothetical protein [unclassified Roseobacter]MDW3181075.1 hypothetical protein [Roseobacter sp.]
MSDTQHPLAPHHLPPYFAGADGSDSLFTVMVIFVLVLILLLGIAYFTLHALPERMAHKGNSAQLQLISILAMLALFTHNNLFWIIALVLAAFRPPDLVSPLNSMAQSLQNLVNREK